MGNKRHEHGWLRRGATAFSATALAAGLLTAGLLAGIAGPAFAGTGSATCTFNGTSYGPTAAVTGVTAGESIAVSCTGVPASTTLAVVEASPLGGVITPSSDAENEADVAAAVLATSSSTGDYSATFTVPTTFSATDPNAACPPTQAQINAGLVDCALAIATTSGVPYYEQLIQYKSQDVTPAAPDVALSPTTATTGDSVAVSEPSSPTGYFWGDALSSSTIPASNILVGGVAASAGSLTVAPASYAYDSTTPADSVLTPPEVSGSFTVPSGVTAGTAAVDIFESNVTPDAGNSTSSSFSNDVEATSSLTQLGTAAITVSPASGGIGTVVTVSGTNWDPQGGKVSVAFTTASSGGTVSSTSATVGSDGSFSASLSVTSGDAVGSNPITATQTSKDGSTLTAKASFTVTAISSTCTIGGTTGTNTCSVEQIISDTVTGTTLTITEEKTGTNPSATAVTLSPITLGSEVNADATGHMNTLQVSDNRGTLAGWEVTGLMETDFTNSTPVGNASDNVIPASNLAWTPAVSLITGASSAGGPSGVLSEVTAGPRSALSTTTPALLCEAAAGGGGGGFNCSAGLSLTVPPYVAAGAYSATLKLTVVGTGPS